MGLRFILGRAGTGKSGRAMDEIKEKSLKDPQGAPIFYIVPDQMTFEQEYKLFSDSDFPGSIRTQVVSFSRLAWRVLQETGGGTKQFISSIGIQMMLRKIIEEKQTDWKVFHKAVEKHGFLQQLERMITEFKRYQVTLEVLYGQLLDLKSYVHKEPGEQALANKLDDLHYIYQHLVTALEGNYMDGEDQLQLLADKIGETDFLANAEIYFDGFHQFTPQELQVVEALLLHCREVTVVLTTENKPANATSELDLFYQTGETYQTILQMAKAQAVPIIETIELEPANGRFRDRAYFAHLEKYFDVRPAPVFDGPVPIQLAEAVHPRAEVEGVAQEMLRLIREEGYRYRDMAIFIRQTEVYQDLIATIFHDYGIPVFVDEKQTMLHHPLIEFIRSMLDVIEGNWRYDAVFRVLKTGLIPITDEEAPLTMDAIDELENYVLEYGIRSREKWFSKEDWIYQRFRGFQDAAQTDIEKEKQQQINRYRKQVVQALQPFDIQFREVETIRERCELIYLFLVDIGVPEKLEQMRESHDERGEIEKGREQEQVWTAVLQLIDEMVEMVGNEALDIPTFRTILNAGFESLEFSHVPPTIDHVIVGTVDHSRISGIKCSFLLGVNEGVWPLKPSADSVINEREREMLETNGLRLADTSKRQLLDDWFYMYTVFTSAKDRLWISYPFSNEEGKSLMPSQLIKRMEDLFAACCNHLLLQEPEESADAERFITTPTKTRGALTAQLTRGKTGYPVKDIWWHVFNWYVEHHAKYSTSYHILQSLYYENKPVDLQEGTVQELFPKKVKSSVSRLESYYRCSYQHFARYSLRLEERPSYKLDAPDIGQLFHEALKMITEWIQQENHDFKQVSEQEAEQYAARAIGKLAPVLQHQVLHSSSRYRYIQQKLEQVIARATFVLGEQARKSNFSPIGLELGFGTKGTLDPVILPLDNGYELMLRGQIDRVDRAEFGGRLYLRIIDYKSSAKDLELVEVYYGLALQMLTYLDVVLSQSEKWLGIQASPAGVLYFHVHNPLINKNEQLSETALEKEIFKSYKMQGLLLAEEEIVRMMDTDLESGYSQVVPAAIKRDGGFYNSKIAAEGTFAGLRSHMHTLMMQAGLDITSGGVHLNPFQYKGNNACTYCPFRSVCQFDPTLDTNNYHRLQEMDDEEMMRKLGIDS